MNNYSIRYVDTYYGYHLRTPLRIMAFGLPKDCDVDDVPKGNDESAFFTEDIFSSSFVVVEIFVIIGNRIMMSRR